MNSRQPVGTQSNDDLSALAWVQEELRKSLDTAHKALRRHLKEAEGAAQSDTHDVEPAVLRGARQQIHQSVGALELIGLTEGAVLLRASENALQRFIAKPRKLDLAAVETIERASFALLDYIGRRLAGRAISAVALFPQLRGVLELAGAQRVHPADLWLHDWRWREIAAAVAAKGARADADTLTRFETHLLTLLRKTSAPDADALRDASASLAAGAPNIQTATLWRLVAAFFEVWGHVLLPADNFVKRMASRVLSQLRAQVRGDNDVSERLAQDLLFYISRAKSTADGRSPWVAAVRDAYDLGDAAEADYNDARLGRFDPVWLAQARKRVGGAKDVWSAVAGGELRRISGLHEAFSLVSESIRRLYPGGERLAESLLHAAGQVVQSTVAPPAPLAMEVATSLLYVEASLEDGELDDPNEGDRVQRLSERIERVQRGEAARPLEGWMEELYRRVSDRQTMGSVVQELRAALSEVERQMDQFFRNPEDRSVLSPVPGQLASMRGVLSVLGMDQGSVAVIHMRDDIDALLTAESALVRAREDGTFERLAGNLGALGFLIDMVSVQPHVAKSLFQFDAATGVLAPLMGRQGPGPVLPDPPMGGGGGGGGDGGGGGGGGGGMSTPDLIEHAQTVGAAAQSGVMPLLEVSHQLEELSKEALASDRPELAASVSSAQAAIEQADQAGAGPATEAIVREHVAQAMADFVVTASEPVGIESFTGAGSLSGGRASRSAPLSRPAPLQATASAVESTGLEEDDEMREIFLEEAREVLETATTALVALEEAPADISQITVVRRSFHTLKGSSRMVGLKDFGEAAWAFEQLYNAWLAEQKPAGPDLQAVSQDALRYMGGWVDEIANRRSGGFSSPVVVAAADALRLQGRLQRFNAGTQRAVPAPLPPAPAAAPAQVVARAVVRDPDPSIPVTRPAVAAVGRVVDTPQAVPAHAPAARPAAPAAAPATVARAPAVPETPSRPNVPVTASRSAAPEVTALRQAAIADEPFAGLDFHLDLNALATSSGDVADEPMEAAQPEVAVATDFDELIDLDLTLELSEPEELAAADVLVIESVDAELPLDEPPAEPETQPVVASLVEPVSEQSTVMFELPLDDATVDISAEGDWPVSDLDEVIVAETASAELSPSVDEPVAASDQVKVVGPLRISIPLFNIYLAEADELSRRLSTELAEWAMELHRPVGESAIALAHSLAGSSATVGFADLSQLARQLERALLQSNLLGAGRSSDASLFVAVAEEIRRLLHQFAAGFLHSPPGDLISRLREFDVSTAGRAERGEDTAVTSDLESRTWAEEADPRRQPQAPVPSFIASAIPEVSLELDLDIPLSADEPVVSQHQSEQIAAESAPAVVPPPVMEVVTAVPATPTPSVAPAQAKVPALPPATAAPVVPPVAAPVVAAPVVAAPVVAAPTVAAPTVAAPTVAAPTVAAPTVAAPTVAAPAPTAPAYPRTSDVAPQIAAIAPQGGPSGMQELGQPELKPLAPFAPSLQQVRLSLPDDDEDAIDAIDAVDADLFPIFEEEAQELLPHLASQMREWIKHPGMAGSASGCMRTLHTFKGGARLAGAMRLGEMAHRLESAIEQLLAHDQIDAAHVEPLQGRVDTLAVAFETLRSRDAQAYAQAQEAAISQPTAAPVIPVQQPVAEKPGAPLARLDVIPAVIPAAVPKSAQPDAAPPRPSETAAAPSTTIDWAQFGAGNAPTTQVPTGERLASASHAVRVRAQLLDRLVNQAGEVSITRARLESEVGQIKDSIGDLTDNLDRLRQQLRDIELQAETQMATRLEAAKQAAQNFDPLEFDRFTRFQELTRMMAESVNDVATVQRALQRTIETTEDELASQARLTRDLQSDLLRTRMVEFDGLSERLYRVVRQSAKETGKQVRLDIVGGSIEVDRGVLDRMTGSFEHLLRNCVFHGIESPDLRKSLGKDPTGTIVVALEQAGNEVSLEFRDDGGGLNLPRIHARAVEMGLLTPDAAPTEGELAGLIFTSGFSTADKVSELAGRGVGMDVVRADVNAMGGRVETATAKGQGTSFKLRLPLTTAVTQVVMMRCGTATVAVPSNLVEIVRRAKPPEIATAYERGSYTFGEHDLPFFWLGALLQISGRGTETGRTLPVVVIRSAQQRVVLHVDEVLGNQEVVVKNLGPQLSRVPGLAGMTLLASGAVALIYNPVALATVYGDSARAQMAAANEQIAAPVLPQEMVPAPVAAHPLVLVVDDSLTVRRVTQRLLTREGYRVVLAKDGLEALEVLAGERPSVVLSDIEMPRMDGFDLLRNIRGDRRLRELPVIMITSRIAQKHREFAAELGANHYLGKPYSEEELLALVRRYVAEAVATVT